MRKGKMKAQARKAARKAAPKKRLKPKPKQNSASRQRRHAAREPKQKAHAKTHPVAAETVAETVQGESDVPSPFDGTTAVDRLEVPLDVDVEPGTVRVYGDQEPPRPSVQDARRSYEAPDLHEDAAPVEDNPREKGEDDGQEYGHPDEALREHLED